MYELEFKQINNAIKNDSLTFFVGAGISKLSNAPSWKELIDSICIQMGMDVKDEYSSDEFLRIPQIYYNYINKDDASYYSFLEEKMARKRQHYFELEFKKDSKVWESKIKECQSKIDELYKKLLEEKRDNNDTINAVWKILQEL